MPRVPKPSRKSEVVDILIRAVNSLPDDLNDRWRWPLEVARVGMTRIETQEGVGSEMDAKAQRDAQFQHWNSYVSRLSPEVRYFIEPINENDFLRSIHRFETLVITRDMLPDLAKCDGDHPGVLRLNRLLSRLAEPNFTYGAANTSGIRAKIFSVTLGRIGEALLGVDATRLRKCPRCKTIFWARANQDYCSTKCGNTVRNRGWRHKPPDIDDGQAKELA
jgi:hypothetical protein